MRLKTQKDNQYIIKTRRDNELSQFCIRKETKVLCDDIKEPKLKSSKVFDISTQRKTNGEVPCMDFFLHDPSFLSHDLILKTNESKKSEELDLKEQTQVLNADIQQQTMEEKGQLCKNKDKYEHFDDEYFQPLGKKQIVKRGIKIQPHDIKIYLINMKTNIERLKRFEEVFNLSDLASIKFEKVDGVNGKELDLTKYVGKDALKGILLAEKTGFRKYHYELTRGAVGCYLSHKKVYEMVVAQNENIAIVFEDDVRLTTLNVLHEINEVINSVPNDWDILLLGCVCFICGKFMTYYDVNRYFLMHGYLIKKESAQKILKIMETSSIEKQIDAHFSNLADEGILKIYCLRDNLAVQWDMGTNIQLPVKNIDGVNPFAD